MSRGCPTVRQPKVTLSWIPTGHLVKDNDDGAEGDGSYMGPGTRQSMRQELWTVYDCGLLPQSGRRQQIKNVPVDLGSNNISALPQNPHDTNTSVWKARQSTETHTCKMQLCLNVHLNTDITTPVHWSHI